MRLNFNFGFGEKKHGGGTASAINPNLLTKTEQFDAAAWVKSGAIVVADVGADPLSGSAADQVTNTSTSGSVAQTSTTAAATGLAAAAVMPTAAWARFSVTAAFDVGSYTFSIWLKDPTSSGYSLTLRLDVSGGFIRCTMRDAGDNAVYLAWGAKLETGASATGDASTYGAIN